MGPRLPHALARTPAHELQGQARPHVHHARLPDWHPRLCRVRGHRPAAQGRQLCAHGCAPRPRVCVLSLPLRRGGARRVHPELHHDLHRPQEDHLQHLLGGSRHRPHRDAHEGGRRRPDHLLRGVQRARLPVRGTQEDHRRGHELGAASRARAQARGHPMPHLEAVLCHLGPLRLQGVHRGLQVQAPSPPRQGDGRVLGPEHQPLPRQLHVRGHLRSDGQDPVHAPHLVRRAREGEEPHPHRGQGRHPLPAHPQDLLHHLPVVHLRPARRRAPRAAQPALPQPPGVRRAPRRGSHHPHLEAQQLLLLRVHRRRVRPRLLPPLPGGEELRHHEAARGPREGFLRHLGAGCRGGGPRLHHHRVPPRLHGLDAPHHDRREHLEGDRQHGQEEGPHLLALLRRPRALPRARTHQGGPRRHLRPRWLVPHPVHRPRARALRPRHARVHRHRLQARQLLPGRRRGHGRDGQAGLGLQEGRPRLLQVAGQQVRRVPRGAPARPRLAHAARGAVGQEAEDVDLGRVRDREGHRVRHGSRQGGGYQGDPGGPLRRAPRHGSPARHRPRPPNPGAARGGRHQRPQDQEEAARG
mmetsp:Transcript_7103/g.32072  ORF Transcript_7103/g.32072 Transcript_7103/m.32072 type:complete len:583 (-) Transcript_7103:642-2390(-)